jgi:hypothetical protein
MLLRLVTPGKSVIPFQSKQRGLHQEVRDWTNLVTEDGAMVLVAAEMEAASPGSFVSSLSRAMQENKGGSHAS